MYTYKYTARDPSTGQKMSSTVEADNEASASRLIRDQGLVPIDMKLSSDGMSKPWNRVTTKDRVLFSRQMSTLINAGLPLMQSLRNVNSQTTNKALKPVIDKVIADVEAGNALSQAMSRHPKVFNKVYISMIAAGEASGTLDVSLQRLADQQEKDADIVAKVRGAMVYPAIVLMVMGLVVGFMLVKVLPQVNVLYEGFPGAQMPLVTRMLLGASALLIKYWWVLLIIFVAASGFIGKYVQDGPGRDLLDKLKMRTPLIGGLFMKMYMARFARTGSTLVASGVPLIQMLEITGEAVNNVHIERSIATAIEKVKAGKSLADAIDKDPNFLELLPNMLRIGEQSGSIEQMLGKVADYFEKEVDNEVKNIQTVIEPVMMVMLGIVAFIIVAAVLLPVYSLAGKSFSV
jgi:type IV pilus assembly protein PilC